MNDRTRTARRIVAQRRAENAAPAATRRAQARIRRQGEATLNRHALAAGLTAKDAQSMAGSLRTNAKKTAVAGHAVTIRKNGHRVSSTRYTAAQVALIAVRYAPRKAAMKTARQYLLAA